MARKDENTAFNCASCGKKVFSLTNGSYRNHCPFCLCSLHVDNKPGDRANTCHGIMKPIAVEYQASKGYMIVHRCQKCGTMARNKSAQDYRQGDDLDVLVSFMNNGIGYI
ncbi:MAG: RNHCP domain-containing protein [Micrococcaceae bacterium]